MKKLCFQHRNVENVEKLIFILKAKNVKSYKMSWKKLQSQNIGVNFENFLNLNKNNSTKRLSSFQPFQQKAVEKLVEIKNNG